VFSLNVRRVYEPGLNLHEARQMRRYARHRSDWRTASLGNKVATLAVLAVLGGFGALLVLPILALLSHL